MERNIKQEISESISNILKEQETNKENFRKLHKKAVTEKEDVMKRFYGIMSNKNKPVQIDEVTLDRVINKHGQNGLINISANRSDEPQEVNDKNTRELISDLQKSGYSYLPTYGGYRGKNGIEDDYEPSFVVFNYTENGEQRDFDELKQFGIELCKKYNQDSVLIKAPQESPIYMNGDGIKVNRKESDKVWKNDPKQEYFTSFKDKGEVNKEIEQKLKGKYKTYCHRNNIQPTKAGFEKFYIEHLNDISSIGKRYTYDIVFNECYVNPMPCQLTERMRRKGEIMIWN